MRASRDVRAVSAVVVGEVGNDGVPGSGKLLFVLEKAAFAVDLREARTVSRSRSMSRWEVLKFLRLSSYGSRRSVWSCGRGDGESAGAGTLGVRYRYLRGGGAALDSTPW